MRGHATTNHTGYIMSMSKLAYLSTKYGGGGGNGGIVDYYHHGLVNNSKLSKKKDTKKKKRKKNENEESTSSTSVCDMDDIRSFLRHNHNNGGINNEEDGLVVVDGLMIVDDYPVGPSDHSNACRQNTSSGQGFERVINIATNNNDGKMACNYSNVDQQLNDNSSIRQR